MQRLVEERQDMLVRTLINKGASLVGFGDVSAVRSDLPVAISLAVKHDDAIVENLHADEEAFHNHLLSLNAPMQGIIGEVESLLAKWGYNAAAMPISALITSNRQLQELKAFSHKMAATAAGLGWIGKCSLLVTPRYGPRIRLGTVLTDAPFKTAEPILESKCGDCSFCVSACPYEAIHNMNWQRGMARDALFDAFLCNEKRLEYIPSIGRKHSCGLCLQACRIGKVMQDSKAD